MLNSEPSTELDKQHRSTASTAVHTEQVKMAATEAGSPRRLGLNLNLSVQPHVTAYHWPHSTVTDDASPSRSKGTDDDDDDDDDRDMDDDDMMDCRPDGDCSPEDEQDILEMQREERETLNQLARQLASGSRLMAPMLQHLVYQHPGLLVQSSTLQHHQQQQQQQQQQPSSQQQQPPGVVVSLTPTNRQPTPAVTAAADLSPKSSHSDETPMSGGHPADAHSPSMSRNSEAQSWTFEEQFRQLYSAGNETDRRSFLDSLFSFMQEQGTPISRLPIMAKRVLDLYTLYKLVVQRGGIVAVITKKLWQEIIRGLGLPPSITSAAFTLRTQYVKYLYAYESRMNQFSTLDELNMAIAGNRREGRRNKSLMYSDLPPPGHPHHHHHQHQYQIQQQQMHGGHLSHPMVAGAVGGVAHSPQPPPSHHHHHYANVLAAEDRFRHLAAAIIDNHHHAAAAAANVGVDHHPGLRLQSCSPPQQQQQHQQSDGGKTTSATASRRTSRSPAAVTAAGVPPIAPPPTSLYNGHQPSSYQQHLQQQQQQQLQPYAQQSNEQTNKQRELLSMLMWMDIVRANQTAMPRLPIPSLPSSPSAAAAAAAYTAAAALNLPPVYKGPMVTAEAVPEQSEALNLGKKRTSSVGINNNNNNNNNNNDGDDNDDNDNNNNDSDAENDRDNDYGGRGLRVDDGDGNANQDGNRGNGNDEDGCGDDGPATKRIKTERCSPVQAVAATEVCDNGSSGEDDADDDVENAHRPAVAVVTPYGIGSPARRSPSPPTDEDVVEMDINASTGGPSGNNVLAICVTRRTKNGVYRGQLTKNSALVNGGLNNNANPFVLHLNGDLYTGHLQLQQQQQQTMTTDT